MVKQRQKIHKKSSRKVKEWPSTHPLWIWILLNESYNLTAKETMLLLLREDRCP